MTAYAYAVTDRPPTRLPPGLDGTPVRCVRLTTGIFLVFGELPGRPAADERLLVAQDSVVRSLWRDVPALLPARFGSTAADAGQMYELVRDDLAGLRERLAHVRGRGQMTLRLQVSSPREPAKAAGVGADYLRGLLARERDEIHELAAVRQSAGSEIVDERVVRHEPPSRLVSVYHLIPMEGVHAYRSAISSAAARMRVSGPHPPYAFAT